MAMKVEDVIQQFADAGLVNPESLTRDDREVIGQLTESEATVLINVAKRLYPDNATVVKLGDIRSGSIRLFVPL